MATKKKASKKKASKKKAARKQAGPDPEFKPERHWLNKGEMAAACGVSVQAFDRWGVQPTARRHSQGEAFFSVSDVLKNRLEHQRIKLEQSQPPADYLDAERAQAAADLDLTRERAEGQRLKNAQLRRELAPVAMVQWSIARTMAEIAAGLESIPGKIKRAFPKMTSNELQIVKREIVKVQNTAAENTKLDWTEFDADFDDPRSD